MQIGQVTSGAQTVLLVQQSLRVVQEVFSIGAGAGGAGQGHKMFDE